LLDDLDEHFSLVSELGFQRANLICLDKGWERDSAVFRTTKASFAKAVEPCPEETAWDFRESTPITKFSRGKVSG
jgi:hypothetical protein